MKKVVITVITVTFIGLLAGCATDNRLAPCPNFGAHCHQVPVNGWDDNQ